MSEDDLLEQALRATREEHDGQVPDPMATLRRVQKSVAAKKRQTLRTRAFLLPIAATLATSTAFAAATGRLEPVFHAVEMALAPAPAPKEETPSRAPRRAAPPPPPVETMEPAPAADPEPPPPAEPASPEPIAPSVASADKMPAVAPRVAARARATSAPVAPASPPRETAPAPIAPPPEEPVAAAADAPSAQPAQPAPAPEKATETAAAAPQAPARDPADDIYLRAHAMHFGSASREATLASWDAYLRAAPNGRFAPEARFNRAITLIKLNRHADAATELAPFANGSYGPYRRDEARALLEAIRTKR